MPYIITVSMRGYLPEQDPIAVADRGAAVEALAEEVERTAGGRDLDGTAELAELLAEVRAMPADGGAFDIGGYCHEAALVTWSHLRDLLAERGTSLSYTYGHAAEAILEAYNTQ